MKKIWDRMSTTNKVMALGGILVTVFAMTCVVSSLLSPNSDAYEIIYRFGFLLLCVLLTLSWGIPADAFCEEGSTPNVGLELEKRQVCPIPLKEAMALCYDDWQNDIWLIPAQSAKKAYAGFRTRNNPVYDLGCGIHVPKELLHALHELPVIGIDAHGIPGSCSIRAKVLYVVNKTEGELDYILRQETPKELEE